MGTHGAMVLDCGARTQEVVVTEPRFRANVAPGGNDIATANTCLAPDFGLRVDGVGDRYPCTLQLLEKSRTFLQVVVEGDYSGVEPAGLVESFDIGDFR